MKIATISGVIICVVSRFTVKPERGHPSEENPDDLKEYL